MVYPFNFILAHIPRWHSYSYIFEHFWATWFFRLCLMPIRIEYRFNPDGKQQYIYCPNHASYLDIPLSSYVIPHFFCFIGKSEVADIPLFGYIFSKIHVSLNRNKLKGRYDALLRAGKKLEEGKSILIYPEGTFSFQPPTLNKFKDGAFRLAIEKQVPIVPISFPFNWIVMPDSKNNLLHYHQIKAIVHEPIETKGLTMNDVDALKEQVFDVISQEMKKHFH
jgi:1-acyl-sn-glycerol-3-phosphate acyltransferase